MKKTVDKFIVFFNKRYNINKYTFSEEEIRKAIDKAAFFVNDLTPNDHFIVHHYLNWLSREFDFEIDTNVDSR